MASRKPANKTCYAVADQSVKATLKRMLLRGSGIRDCAVVLNISTGCVIQMQMVVSEGLLLEIKPQHTHYQKVQIDILSRTFGKQWSYVGKKEKKVWLIYTICAERGEIQAASWGKPNKKNVRMLLLKLKQLEINIYGTDDWVSFKEVLPPQKHVIGKEHTKKIEGINTWFRVRLRRLMRRTTCFSKKLKYHYANHEMGHCQT